MTKSTMFKVATSLALVPALFDGAVRVAASRCFARARRLDARSAAMIALAALMMTAAADPAFAQASGGNTDITTMIQNVVNIITGTAGKLLAILGICGVAIACLFGAMSLRAAGSVVVGIILLFGSAWLVGQIAGQS
jgi:type IV secretory pathway VirB2 component (pilin)